jgi:hypothetical protein
MKARDSRSKLFLSHSGLDATLSAKVQQAIEAVFADRALDITVFNTSTPHDRFKTLESCLAPGTPWAREVVTYEEELKRYLRRNLAESAAYLLLVTPASLATQSKWIRFEIDVAPVDRAPRQDVVLLSVCRRRRDALPLARGRHRVPGLAPGRSRLGRTARLGGGREIASAIWQALAGAAAPAALGARWRSAGAAGALGKVFPNLGG